jgi:hypothetical protein
VEIKFSEIQHGTLRIVRKCRIVTYVMGVNAEGKDEVLAEVDEAGAAHLINSIAEGQRHERDYPGVAEEGAAPNLHGPLGTEAHSH